MYIWATLFIDLFNEFSNKLSHIYLSIIDTYIVSFSIINYLLDLFELNLTKYHRSPFFNFRNYINLKYNIFYYKGINKLYFWNTSFSSEGMNTFLIKNFEIIHKIILVTDMDDKKNQHA